MTAATRKGYAEAVEKEHGGQAIFVRESRTRQVQRGETVAEARVYVFDMIGHPEIDRIYVRPEQARQGAVAAAVVRFRTIPLAR